jgi:hypothetical protein
MIITKMSLPRRTFLKGMGTTLALPFLDAMVPALKAEPKATPRFTAIYFGNGANMEQWTPATDGAGFGMPSTLKSLEPFRDRLTVVTGLDNFPATDQGDTGGQHPRASVAFMSSAHAKQTEGADVRAGTTVDQIAAAELCKELKLSSLELGVERNDVVGACDHGYACAYMNSLAWKTPTMPLPTETNPRFVFERLFGSGDTAEERVLRSREDRSILDVVTRQIGTLKQRLSPRDAAKLSEYLDAIRDVEQRISKIESYNSDLSVPDRPVGAPQSFREHAEVMFDLQALAFQADITRVSTFMLARENSKQPYAEIGLAEEHHAISHHGNNPDKLAMYAKLNAYHVDMFAYYLKKLDSIKDGSGTLLDHSIIMYGSGMSDGNIHSNYNLPVVVLGGRSQGLKGDRHIRVPKGTPLANLSLTLLDKLGVPTNSFGDSTGELDMVPVV